MKVLVIGGVAAGTKTAAKLKRENRGIDVKIITMSEEISYAGCGLPYYVGDLIKERSKLIVNTPKAFSRLTGAEVETGTEAVKIDPEKKTVTAVHLKDGSRQEYEYDKLVIATGASPIVPPVPGVDLQNVFYMRTPDDAENLKQLASSGQIKRAVIAGGGFIGLEVAENLKSGGADVTVIDMASHIMPGFDPEMAGYAERHLRKQGIQVLTDTRLEEIIGEHGKAGLVKTSKKYLMADAVILSLGIRPNTAFLDGTGIELTQGKTIKVNKFMETSVKDIYAMGDCAMVTNRITGKPAWSPMGSSANIEGRLAARNLNGGAYAYPGVLGTGIVKLPGLNAGRTGLSETAARAEGYDPITVVSAVDDKAHYYPGADNFIIKLIADRNSRKLLGVQCLGPGAVDKIIDIAVMAISMNAGLSDLENLDFAYAPPFSTAIHPLVNVVNVLQNKLNGEFVTFTPAQFENGETEGYRIIEASPKPVIKGVTFVDLTEVNGLIPGVDPEEKLLLICQKGKRAYLLQNRMRYYGYKHTRVLEGGLTFNADEIKKRTENL